MQLHMFWALYIHAADHQGVKEDWEKQREVFGDLQRLRELLWNSPLLRDDLALRHVPELAQTLEDYCTRGAYDEFWAAKENDFTRFWHEHADIPATMTTGWYDPFPHADSEYFAAMTAKNEAPQRLIIGPWSHVGMRGDGTWTLDVDFGPTSVWGVQRYFDEQLDFFNRWLPDDATGQPADEAPVKIFVMGGGSGRRTELGKLDHGGRWRDEQEWPLARAIEQTLHLHPDGSLRAGGARGGRRAAAVHVRPGRPRPDDRRPLLRRRRDAVRRRGARAGVGAPAQPGAHAPEHHDPGRRRPEGVGRVLHRARALPAAVGAGRRARLPDRAARGGRSR